jgi:hypothetical protein
MSTRVTFADEVVEDAVETFQLDRLDDDLFQDLSR